MFLLFRMDVLKVIFLLVFISLLGYCFFRLALVTLHKALGNLGGLTKRALSFFRVQR